MKAKYYRNINDFQTQTTLIDAGSLWKLKGDTLILVDDDNYVETKFNPALFQIAE